MRREGRRRLRLMSLLFGVVVLAALLVGWFWPKSYFGVATVLVSQDKSIQKLMDGRAVTTSVSDRVMIAREVITSAPVLDDALELGGWLADSPDSAERKRRAETMRRNTQVGAPRENLIRIEFRDQDPVRAAAVAQFFAERFMHESRTAQQLESAEAHDFIATEVGRYSARLARAEAGISRYHAENPGSRSAPAGLLEARILQLQGERDLAMTSSFSTQQQRGGSVAARTASTEMSLIDTRLAQTDRELDAALLRYTEAHPEARRLLRQRNALVQQLSEAKVPSTQPVGSARSSEPTALAVQPVATSNRVAMLDAEIERELDRLAALSQPAPALAVQLREREVARELLHDLLRRLEYASLSKRLDEQGRGLGLQLQEAAATPVQSTGPRFAHFMLGGVAAASTLPLVLLFALVRYDPHLRSAAALSRGTGIPVIATVPMYWTSGDHRLLQRDRRQGMIAIAFAVLLLGLASIARLAMAA